MSNARVLIVDDNPGNLRLAEFVLASYGFNVATATNAEEALTAVERVKPAVIIMDIQLPGMDGLELTRRLKADPTTRGIAIVAVTAYAMEQDEVRAREAGCEDYIAKPIDTRSFAGRIANVLATHEGGSALRRG
ncbi:MAG: response regulator [Deltaproteobacteria bacterium]|nr:response regulator [Deltaproteobacteria bacterium]